MRTYLQSLAYALQGLAHTIRSERNFRLFLALYILSLLIGGLLGIDPASWALLIFTGGIFLAVELINTSLEHFTDAFDVHSRKQEDHHIEAIKATKDIAAAASLLCLLAWGSVLLIVYWPHIAKTLL